MKKRKLITEKEQDLLFICLISSGNNYNRIISKELKLKPNTTITQLKFLEKNNFLISERNEKYNILTYSVNWEKINEEFIKYKEQRKGIKRITDVFEELIINNKEFNQDNFLEVIK